MFCHMKWSCAVCYTCVQTKLGTNTTKLKVVRWLAEIKLLFGGEISVNLVGILPVTRYLLFTSE